MNRKKLTVSVEERLIRRAKVIAKKRGTSISRLVETFFSALEPEREESFESEQARQRGAGEPPEDSDDASSAADEPSEWARRWRGAFAEEGKTYPEDSSWEEEVLPEEIQEKHAS